MARLRYNGLTATLGAALTTSATSVTFGAALTHANGVAVPTVASPDYIPLSILDSSGNFSEIVYLTAYTSGATTGTITRAAEGAGAAVAHNLGDKVVHGPTALDVLPGSRFDDPMDPLWAGNLGYDQEFDADDTSGSLPSGWSWVNQTTSTYQQQWGAGIITPAVATGTDGGHTMIVRGIPAQSAWKATLKFGGQNDWVAGYVENGIVLRESSSGKYTYFGLRSNTTNTVLLNASSWNSPGNFNSTVGNLTIQTPSSPFYLRIVRAATPSYSFQYSINGVTWGSVASNATPFGTFDQIGLLASAPGGATPGVGYPFYWFRVR